MKIVFLSFYSGFVSRGVETFVAELSKRLAKKHKVLVVRADPIVYPQRSEIPRCAQEHAPGVGFSGHLGNFRAKRVEIKMKWPNVDSRGMARGLMIDYYYRKISWFTLKSLPVIFKFKPDVIIPTNGGWQSLLIKVYTLINRSKMIISGQAGLGRDDKWNLLLKPDVFVALSKRNTEWAKRFSKRVRIEIIPNGVDLARFKVPTFAKASTFTKATADKSADRQGSRFKVNLGRPIILCVAGHEKYKRVRETIKAIALLKKSSLLVVGGSEETKSLGKNLLGNHFSQLKFSHKKMPQVYKSADLFTLVSESSEAFGIAYLEAMACGLPVVATNDELRREIVGKAGLFIKNPENSRMYARRLKKALKKDWKNLPRKQAEKFSWDRVAEKYEKLLEDL